MKTIWQDLRFGARMLLKKPGFTAAAVLTLALGLGVNTSIFSWVNSLLLNSIPGAAKSDELVMAVARSRLGTTGGFSYPDYIDFRDQNHKLSGLLTCSFQAMNVTVGERAERVWGELVSGNYFDVLGVKLLRGRTFLSEEDRTPGANPVAVISYGLWQRRFGGDPAIAGKSFIINNLPFTIVGVTPPGFRGSWTGLKFEIWVPMMMQKVILPEGDMLHERGNHWFSVMGRLRPGVKLAQAREEFAAIAGQLERQYPDSNRSVTATLVAFHDSPYGGQAILGPVLLAMMGLTMIVLLIACANVANLLLVRAADRHREITVRLALGASRSRIIRQLLAESLLLAVLGGMGALLLASWTSGVIVAFVPPMDYPVELASSLNSRVMIFTMGLSLLSGVIFGLAPALQSARTDLSAVLKEEGGTTSGSRRKAHLRNILVVAQITFSLALLICAGLFIRSLREAQRFNPGFNPDGVLLSSLDLFPNGYGAEKGTRFYEQLLDRIGTLPGVRLYSIARRLPLGFGGNFSQAVSIEGYHPSPDETVGAEVNWVGPGYFRTLEIPLDDGREFSRQDDSRGMKVLIVNETMARHYWPGQSPLGKRVEVDGQWHQVVGLARNSKTQQLNEPPKAVMYLPLLQHYRADVTILVRTAGEPAALAAALRKEIQGLDPTLPLFNICPLARHITAASLPQRMASSQLGAFGLLSLVIAVVGLYGVLAHAAAQRTREIGIRMAFGAQRRNVLAMVAGQGLKLVTIGVVLGVAGAMAASRFFASLLFGISPTDPLVFLSVPMILILVALLACYLPAHRAAGIHPMEALHYE